MSQTENRTPRSLLLSVMCLVAWQCVAVAPALAQRRAPSNSPPETPSQRWLPLPQGSSADFKQQVQWLQQLKGLLGTDGLGGAMPALPKLDPEQLKALVDAVKQLGGEDPDGTQPPARDGISTEQISKAMADPAIREQARRMLEQFSRDGKLPQNRGATNSQGVPFPPTSNEDGKGNEGGKGTSGESPHRDRPDSATGPESSALPPAMLKLLQRLAEEAARQQHGLPPERDPLTGGPSERESGNDNRNSPSPDGQRVKPGTPPTNDAARLNNERLGTETPGVEPTPRIDRKVGGRESNAVGASNDPNRTSRQPGADDQRPAGNQPPGTTQPRGVIPPSGSAGRPQGSQSNTPEQPPGTNSPRGTPRGNDPAALPSLPSSVAEMLRNGPMTQDQPFQAGSSDPRSDRSNPRTSELRNSNSTTSPSNSGPSMTARSNGGTPSGLNSTGSGNSVPARRGSQPSNQDRTSRGSAMSPAPSPQRGPTPAEPLSGETRPPMDIRSELEQQGFAQTLRKIVEQAREESLANPNDSPVSSSQSLAMRNGSSPGHEGSLNQMLDGVRRNLVETARETPLQSVAPDRTPPRAAPSSAPPPVPERRSAMNTVTKAAGNFLSDLATAPAARPASVRSSPAATTRGSAGSQDTGSRSTVGLLMLLAVLGLAWYFVPQLLAAMNGPRLAESPLGGGMQLIDIRTRGDVVRAFHQYALRPATPAPTWWTHREVERQVADETPALRPTIQTLADLYEQARYLPDEADFTSDQIGTARRALEQCEASQPRG